MPNYSKEEIAEFKAKDLRISKLAIVKSLIEKLDLKEINEVEKVTKLAEKYIDYVYRKRSTKRGQADCVAGSTEHNVVLLEERQEKVNWEQIAVGLNLAIPNSQNIKMLNHLIDEHKKANKASANPKDVLTHIINMFGQYPTKTESVTKVLESLKG